MCMAAYKKEFLDDHKRSWHPTLIYNRRLFICLRSEAAA